MGSIKRFSGFFLFLFVVFPLFPQNNSAGPVSLAAEISRLEKIASSGASAPREKCGAFLGLARLYSLSGNPEAAVKAYEGAAAALPGDGQALLEQGRFLISLGEYEKAGAAINALLGGNHPSAILVQGRFLAAKLEAFRSGGTQALAALVSDPAFAAVRSEIYYTLWKLTGLLSWRSRLVLEFPQSPEAKIAAGSVDSAPSALWLLFPGRDSIASAPASSAVPAAPAAPASAPPEARPLAEPGVMLQTGLFGREDNARAMAERIKRAGFDPRVSRRRVNNNDFWAVGVPAGTDMNALIQKLKDAGFESFPVR